MKTAFATVSAVIDDNGIATGHRVKRSMMVSIYSFPFTRSRGPTKSTCVCVKRPSGFGKVDEGALPILVAWQR